MVRGAISHTGKRTAACSKQSDNCTLFRLPLLDRQKVPQQDSARHHKASLATEYLENSNINMTPWSSLRSPDLNSIEEL